MFTNIRPVQTKRIAWPWKNIRNENGTWATEPRGKIRVPKNFIDCFDWTSFVIENTADPATAGLFIGSRNFKSVFTTAARMVGYEKLLVDKPGLLPICDAYTDWNVRLITALDNTLFANGIVPQDFWLFFGDDIAHRNGLIMSPEMTKAYSLYYCFRMVNYIKQETRPINMKLRFMFHSDGDIYEILPDLVERFEVISFEEVGRMRIFQPGMRQIENTRLIVHNPNELGTAPKNVVGR